MTQTPNDVDGDDDVTETLGEIYGDLDGDTTLLVVPTKRLQK